MTSQDIYSEKFKEPVLVVATDKIVKHLAHKGLTKVSPQLIQDLVKDHGRFIPRGQAETDTQFKQLIPFITLLHKDEIFIVRRSKSASEQRLADRLTLGVGGHLKESDLEAGSFFCWGQRELDEELVFKGDRTNHFVGLINDETNPVGQVHTGIFWVVDCHSKNIKIREELASGEFIKISQCREIYNSIDIWGQIAFDFVEKLNLGAKVSASQAIPQI